MWHNNWTVPIRNPMLDGKRYNWARKTFIKHVNLMKLVCAIFTLHHNAFCYFFQGSEKGKSDNDNDFKISWATYCSRSILDSTKQTKWKLWDGNLFTSSQLFSLSSNLFLYSWNKLSRKCSPPQHISSFKKVFEKCKSLGLFLRFCGTLL